MTLFLRIALWNANGLAQHCQEIKYFIQNNKIDVLLVSETHFTDRTFFKIPNFTLYNTNHPDNTAHGGSAVLIKNTIKHYELPKFQQDHLQASSVVVEDWAGPITLSSVYCPPRHAITSVMFENYFNILGNKFIAGGDYNAKHQQWGSRLANPRGRALFKTLEDNNYSSLSTGEPTYWPTDMRKLPDVLDIFVAKGIPYNYLLAESCLDLSSDHSPVIVTLSTTVVLKTRPTILYNKNTDWDAYRNFINQQLTLNISLKTPQELEGGIELLNEVIQISAKQATPPIKNIDQKQFNYPLYIKNMISNKRRLRRIWQNSRSPVDKANLNRAAQNLKRHLFIVKNQWFTEYSENLSPSASSDYSLWKATKHITNRPQSNLPPILKQDGSWAKSNLEKSEVFGTHFESVFKPHNDDNPSDQVLEYLDSPLQMTLPVKPFSPSEIRNTIGKDLKEKKSPGHDLITGKLLKELPRKCIVFITLIFNAVLRLEHFPLQWKKAQLVVVPKPGKPNNQATSYRPISLLPVISKVFEKLFLRRIHILIKESDVLPYHQFGFRQKHSTIEQIHRIVDVIRQDLENKRYCSAAFLDVTQAFDKVWHTGLLYKIKKYLPHSCFKILKSYLSDRSFQIKYQDILTSFYEIKSGVPQGSVLGPFLYILFTADLPCDPNTTVATFADDTAILSSHFDPVVASQNLQISLQSFSNWLNEWRIKVNESKSTHVTFSLRSQICPPVYLNNNPIPQSNEVKYLGMTLDRKLNWRSHIWLKRQQLNLKLNNLNWLLGRKSKLSLKNKLLVYKVILKPVWTYGIQLWGTASSSNIEILQRFQSKVLRTLTGAPWYVSNLTLHRDLKVPCVKDEIRRFSENYLSKLNYHPNYIAVNLLDNSNFVYRLKRSSVLDLSSRF